MDLVLAWIIETGHQISYVSDDAFDLNLDKIFDEYDDVFKALVEE